MNLFLLPGYYENSKKKQMNDVYGEVAALFDENDWKNISDKQKDKVYDSLDKISANSSVSVYIMSINVDSSSGMVSKVDYLYPSMGNRTQQLNTQQLAKYVMFKQLGNVFVKITNYWKKRTTTNCLMCLISELIPIISNLSVELQEITGFICGLITKVSARVQLSPMNF